MGKAEGRRKTEGRGRRKHAEFKFTVKALEALTCPEGAERAVWYDSEVPGLGVAVYPSGRLTFFHLRKVLQWVRRSTIGEFPALSIEQARSKASGLNQQLETWKADARDGKLVPVRRLSPTLEELVKDYVERRLGEKLTQSNGGERKYDWDNSGHYREWLLNRYVAKWRNRRVSTIGRSEIRDLHRELGTAHGHHMANRVVQFLRTVFNYGLAQELWTGTNPVQGIDFFPEQKRERFLQPDEMKRLFNALADFEERETRRAKEEDRKPNLDLKDYVLLALFTGARRSDVLAMRWPDIVLDTANTWKVPQAKTDRPYVVPLIPEAVAILIDRRARVGTKSEWVFPSRGSSGHVMDLKRGWKELLGAAEITDLRQHDLRRTLGSWQAGAGVSMPIIAKTLGHSSLDATEIYARVNLDPVRQAVMTATRAMLAAANAPAQLPATKSKAKAADRG